MNSINTTNQPNQPLRYSDKPEDRPPLPHRQPNPSYSVSVRQPEGDYGNKEVKSTAAKKEMTEAEKEAEKERKKELQRTCTRASVVIVHGCVLFVWCVVVAMLF